MAIEILAVKIRSNNNIKGLEFQGLNTKISMYADDTSFLPSPDNTCLQNLIKDLDDFSNLSGLKPNYDKCHILKLGPLKNTDFSLQCDLPIKWIDGLINVLGIHIPENMNEISTLNFNNKLSKITKILQPWKGKYLTIYGKITLINSLIISQFTYYLWHYQLQENHFSKHMNRRCLNLYGMINKIKLGGHISIMITYLVV